MRHLSEAQLKKLEKRGAKVSTPKKKKLPPVAVATAPEPKVKRAPLEKFKTTDSSPEMRAAVAAAQRAAEAAEQAAINTNYMANNIIEIIRDNQVIKLKINRAGKDQLMDTVDLIRATN